MRPRRNRPLFIIDIAMPRDVEPAAGEIEQVFLYNIDDLQATVRENLARRATFAKAPLPIKWKASDAVGPPAAWAAVRPRNQRQERFPCRRRRRRSPGFGHGHRELAAAAAGCCGPCTSACPAGSARTQFQERRRRRRPAGRRRPGAGRRRRRHRRRAAARQLRQLRRRPARQLPAHPDHRPAALRRRPGHVRRGAAGPGRAGRPGPPPGRVRADRGGRSRWPSTNWPAPAAMTDPAGQGRPCRVRTC